MTGAASRTLGREEAADKSAASPAQPVVILIAGMHCSGTAAISSVLNRLGAAIPGASLPPGSGNATGFFEDRRIVGLHDALLEELGSLWDDPLPLGEKRFRWPKADAKIPNLAAIFTEEFGKHPLVLVEGPSRFRLLPLWIVALSQLGRRVVAILPYRDPLEVAASLVRRDSLSRAHAFALWLQHVLAAEHATRGMERCLVVFEELFLDWRSVTRRIGERLGLRWPRDGMLVTRESDGFPSPEPCRLGLTPEGAREHDALEGLSLRVWDALQRLFADEGDEKARCALDEAAGEFEGALCVLAPLLGSLDQQLVRARGELQGLGERANEAEARLTHSESELDRIRSSVARLEREREVRRGERDAVLSSTFWRLTGPARQLLAAMPPGLTRQARRGARAAYWLLTPHRMPQRVAYLRSPRILLPSVPTHVGEPAATADNPSRLHFPSHRARQRAESGVRGLRLAPEIIVSIHVPKTAGTSFGNALEQYFSDRLLSDYQDRPLMTLPEFERRRIENAKAVYDNLDKLLRDYEVVHGHFIASKYLPLGRRARFAIFFREPVARTISHYNFWRRRGPDDQPIAHRIRSGELSLEGFAKMPKIRSFYARFLGGIDLDQFAFIGLTEAYETSLELFNAVFGVELAHLRENVGLADPEGGGPTKRVLDAVKAAQQENTELYEQARRRFDALCAAYLKRP